jgi:hypothetical protein
LLQKMSLAGFTDFSPEAAEPDYGQSAQKEVKELNTFLTRLTPRAAVLNFTHFPVSGRFPVGELTRAQRLQIMLSESELVALDDWRFSKRMPSRASAIRELLRRGLQAEGFALAGSSSKSKDFGVVGQAKSTARKPR